MLEYYAFLIEAVKHTNDKHTHAVIHENDKSELLDFYVSMTDNTSSAI